MAEERRSFSPALIYNSVTMAMLALVLVACCLTVVMALTWPRTARPAPPPTATLASLSTATPTALGPTRPAPGPEDRSGEAGETPSEKEPEASVTPGEGPTATEGFGLASVDTDTPAPEESATTPAGPTTTPTLGVTPSVTQSAFAYLLRDGLVTFTSNPAENGACNWAGVAGGVFDRTGQHVIGFRVHVFGPSVDVRVLSGSAAEWGASGWEVQVGSAPDTNAYFVQLESPTGDIQSESITVQMVADCSRNLALLNFDEAK